MSDFHTLGLSETLLHTLTAHGIAQPTEIQSKVIPTMLMGRDILASAKTGSGKTASYALPMLDILNERRGRARMPRAIVLSPTRELAAQVAENFDRFGEAMRLNMLLLIGGIQMSEQERILTRGVDVLIATPGRLLDHVERGKVLLSGVEILVIDEVDRMLDIGFIDDIDRLVKLLPQHQTLMLSATMPGEMETLAQRFLHNPKRIIADPPSQVSSTIEHTLLHLPSASDKSAALLSLLQQPEVEGGIIFCNRKRDVSSIQHYLNGHGLSVAMLHGDMDQHQRLACLQSFRNQQIAFLVCSDVAARGLDIPSVDFVFNVDVPSHAEDYVHRIGRTGRAGRSGKAVTLAVQDDAKYLQAIEKIIGGKITPHVLAATWNESDKVFDSSVSRSTKSRKKGRKDTPSNMDSKAPDAFSSPAQEPDKTRRRGNHDDHAAVTRLRDNDHVPRFLLR